MSFELGLILFLAIAAVLWGFGKPAIERAIARGVDERFDRRLEDHKHALALTAEQARFELQRDLANFHLYTTKRYASAEAVYDKVRRAHGAVVSLFGVTEQLTFQEYSAQDMETYLVSRGVAEGMRKDILATWNTDRPASLKILKPYLRQLEVHEAHNALIGAQNETFLNELYLSETAGKALNALFTMLNDWVYIAKNPTHGLMRKYSETDVRDALTSVHQLLRAELRDGPKTADTAKSTAITATS